MAFSLDEYVKTKNTGGQVPPVGGKGFSLDQHIINRSGRTTSNLQTASRLKQAQATQQEASRIRVQARKEAEEKAREEFTTQMLQQHLKNPQNAVDYLKSGTQARSGSFGGGETTPYRGGFTGDRVTGQPDAERIAKGVLYQTADQIVQPITSFAAAAEGVVTKPMGWLLGNEELYKSGPLYGLNEWTKKNTEQNQLAFEDDYKRAGKVGELIGKYGPSVGAAIPNAVIAYITAGQNLLYQQSTAGLIAASNAAKGAGIAQTVTKVLTETAKNPGFQYSLVNTMGSEYEQAKADGASELEAYAYAAVTGLTNALVEIGGGIEELPKKAGIKAWIKTMLDEGKEEVIQGAISQLSQRLMYGKDNPLISMTDENAIISGKRAKEEFTGGAVVGGILGGAQNIIQSAQEASTARNAEAAEALQKPKLPNVSSTNAPASDFKAAVSAPVSGQENILPKQENAAEQTPVAANVSSEQRWANVREANLATAKKLLGKNGYEAFEANYNRQTSYGDLTRAYNNGLSNTPSKSNLTPEQYNAMFEAGRADAKASVRNQINAAPNVVTQKKENSGIDFSDADTKAYVESSVDTNTARALNVVAKALGVKVRFADEVANNTANAQLLNGVVTIEKGNPNPVRFLFGHEITHRMQELAPAEYSRLREALAADGTLEAQAYKVQKEYAKQGKTISHEDALDEAVADRVGGFLENEGELERFIERHREDRTLLEKLRDLIRDLADKLRGTIQYANARNAERLLNDALDASVKQVKANQKAQKNTTQASGVAKNSLKNKEQIAKQLQKIRERQVDYSLDSVSLGTIPDIYTQLFDIAELDLTINMRHAYNEMVSAKTAKKEGMYRDWESDDYHNMGVDGYASAIHSVSTPLVIMDADKTGKRKNLRISMILRADGIDEPLFGIIELYSTKRIDGGTPQRTHAQLTIYDKATAPDYVKTAGENSRVLYIDKEQDLRGTPAHQLRSSVSDSALKKNLADFNKKVNIFKKENRIDDASLESKRVESGRYEDVGVAYDAKTESAAPGKLSLKTWNTSEYMQERNKAAKELSEALGVSQQKAADYIDSINSVAKMIADDRVRLDYEASPGRSAFVSNSEYGGSIDFSTICKKRRLFTGTFEAIQNALPNTALTAEEILEIRSMMDEKGYEVSCGLCYVEGSRANMGQYTKQFLERYAATNPAYMPNMAEMNTATGQERIRREHPEVYEAYEYFMNHYGRLNPTDKALFASQQKPKMYQMSSEYQGEILEQFGKKNSKVEEKNRNGGLRIQSFSDFEIIHLIDSMQVIMDMSRVGLAGQAYTKVPDFAWALGDTGLKINLSLIAKDVDSNGRLVLDEKEGMNVEDAIALRNRYSENVGTIVVAFTDEQLSAAMADERIDFIIPFHRSQWKTEQYEAMGLPKNAKDFTNWQNEAYIQPVYNKNGKKQRPDNYMPNAYWDFNKSGKENAESYLRMCAENNRRPKFSNLLVNNGDGSYSLQPDGSTDGYWKLLIDFKMYDNNGNGAPQRPVKPDFNMDEAQRMLENYTGGHSKFPAAQDVVDEFVDKYKKDHKGETLSLKGSESLGREIERLIREGKQQGRSEEDVQADIRAAVDEVYQGMIEDYGAMEPGEKPAREVQVPQRTDKDKKVSQTVRTILEAGATPDEMVPNIEKLVATGAFSYDVYTDKAAIADAEQSIRKTGWEKAQRDWFSRMEKGEVSKELTTKGWVLYNNAANIGDTALALDILDAMVKHQRNAAQALQATRILKKLSPETQLYNVQRSVEGLQEELNERYGAENAPTLKVDKDLAEQYLQATTQEERDTVLKEIYRDIGKQVPSRFIDKWNAWRYLAMLGNPRTHVRNFFGNFFFAPVVGVKNMTATAIESAVSRLSGGRIFRTKSALNLNAKADRDLLTAAWGDYKNAAEVVGDGKYDELKNTNKYIAEGQTVFKFKPLEAARKANSKALSLEDAWFSQTHYAAALASYCKANGITAAQIESGKGMKEARAYALKEAQKATYQDTNAFSQTISQIGRSGGKNKNIVGKGLSVLMEGILPFRKTPANILVRGLEYSPAGLLKGLTLDLWRVQNKKITAAEAIDNISAGLTGTGLLAFGVYLAAEGLVRGHGSGDEEEKKFEELMGHQSYALELPNGTSVTLDWLAPEALPFFVGVNLWEQTAKENEELTLSAMLEAVETVTEPLLEMSCLQSLNAAFDAVGYASSEDLSAIATVIAAAATSYLTQALPTIMGQAERTSETQRMTTYTEKDAFLTKDMQYTLGKASAKIPVWDYKQIPYIDAWGRAESSGGVGTRAANNFLNPAYTSKVENSAMEDELLRLYEATGEGSVLPDRAARYFNVNKQRKDLTGQEYVDYATKKGQTAYNVLSSLVSSEGYRAMTDTQKVAAISSVYSYANAVAKMEVSVYKPEGWVANAIEATKNTGIKPEQYVVAYLLKNSVERLKDAKGETITNSEGLQIMEQLYAMESLTTEQRNGLFEDFKIGKTIRGFSKAKVESELKKMRRQAQ